MCMDTWHLVLSAGVAPACITKLYSDATAFLWENADRAYRRKCVSLPPDYGEGNE